MTTIDIACSCDDRYVPHHAAMLRSLSATNPAGGLRIHFLCGPELGAANRRALEGMASDLALALRWIEVPEELVRDLPARDYLSRVVWYRIFMPGLLPELDRVLYLDSDVIALAPLAPLWATELDEHLVAAVTNVVPEHFRDRATALGLPGAQHYFNAGIALWNLAAMRREGLTQQVLAFARANIDRLRWLEQDALNALYWQRRLPLHPRWNAQNGIFYGSWGTRLLDQSEVQEALRQPALLHFEGGSFAKPWHFLSEHPLRERYFEHRNATPWPHRWHWSDFSIKDLAVRYLPAPAQHLLRRIVRAIRRSAARVRVGT